MLVINISSSFISFELNGTNLGIFPKNYVYVYPLTDGLSFLGTEHNNRIATAQWGDMLINGTVVEESNYLTLITEMFVVDTEVAGENPNTVNIGEDNTVNIGNVEDFEGVGMGGGGGGGESVDAIPETSIYPRMIFYNKLNYSKPPISGTTRIFVDGVIHAVDNQEILPYKILVVEAKFTDMPQELTYLPINVHIFNRNKVILYAYTQDIRNICYVYYKVDDTYSGWVQPLTDKNVKSEQIVTVLPKSAWQAYKVGDYLVYKQEYLNPIIQEKDNIVAWGLENYDIEVSAIARLSHTLEISDGKILFKASRLPIADINIIININGYVY
jgi:hypothetical protein